MPTPWEGTWVEEDVFGDKGVSPLSSWNEEFPDESRLGRSGSGFPFDHDDSMPPIPGINLPSPGDFDADADDYHE
jgi:hypothetical protein